VSAFSNSSMIRLDQLIAPGVVVGIVVGVVVGVVVVVAAEKYTIIH